jgi:hypothetical protein
MLDMTSAMHIVAERLTPTRQWTSVAVLDALPRPANKTVSHQSSISQRETLSSPFPSHSSKRGKTYEQVQK